MLDKNATILLVDDEPYIVDLVREILVMHGFQVLEATSGEDALEIGADHPEPIHLLLTDVRMGPSMSGGELAQALRALRPEIAVLYMSAYNDDDIVTKEVMEAVADFLPKPFTPKVLIGRVRDALNSRREQFQPRASG